MFNLTAFLRISYTLIVLTLTTKQLREDMPRAISELQQGNPITLTYRHKVVGTIEPAQVDKPAPRRGDLQAFLEFMKNTDFGWPEHIKNDPRDTVELVKEMKEQHAREKFGL